MEESTEKNGELLSLRDHEDDVGGGGDEDKDYYDIEHEGATERRRSRNVGM